MEKLNNLNFNYRPYVRNESLQYPFKPNTNHTNIPLQPLFSREYSRGRESFRKQSDRESPQFNGVNEVDLQKYLQDYKGSNKQSERESHVGKDCQNEKKKFQSYESSIHLKGYNFQQLVEELQRPSLKETPRDVENQENINENSLTISSLQVAKPSLKLQSFSSSSRNFSNEYGSNGSGSHGQRNNQSSVCLNSMANQLDDLKSQIKDLESKLDHSKVNHSRSSSKQSIAKVLPYKLSSSRIDLNESEEGRFFQKGNRNISWGESQIILQNSQDDCKSNSKKRSTNQKHRKNLKSQQLIDKYQVENPSIIQSKKWEIEDLSDQKFVHKLKRSMKGASERDSSRTHQSSKSILKNSSSGVNYFNEYQKKSSVKQFQTNKDDLVQILNKNTSSRGGHFQGDQENPIFSSIDKEQTLEKEKQTMLSKQSRQMEQSQTDTIRPDNLKDLTGIKQSKEVRHYKDKCKKLSKQCKELKSEIESKDQLLNNQKKLSKELKIIKEQWRMSEEIRADQKKQIKSLQQQLELSQKENQRTQRKLQKYKNKANASRHEAPMRVVIQEKHGRSQTFN